MAKRGLLHAKKAIFKNFLHAKKAIFENLQYCLDIRGVWYTAIYVQGFQQSEIQTSLLSYSDYLQNWIFGQNKSRYDTFQLANNKGADQTVRKLPKTGFLARGPYYPSSEGNWNTKRSQYCKYKCIRPTYIVTFPQNFNFFINI